MSTKIKTKKQISEKQSADKKVLVLRDQNRKPRLCKVKLIDTMPLVPGGKSLDHVGHLIGLKKRPLPEGQHISRMKKFFCEEPAEAEAYALRDSQATQRFGKYIIKVFSEEFGLNGIPTTIGSAAVRYFVKQFGDAEHFRKVFGQSIEKESYWHIEKQKFCSRTVKNITPEALVFYDFAARCFRGGRSEAFVCGLSGAGEGIAQYDVDLPGAYSTGLLIIREPDYAGAYMSTNPDDFCGEVMGFVYADFEFPEETQYPCIQIPDGTRGLFFPLQGTSYFTAPELELALEMGAKINIRTGVVVPWANENRVFEPFVRKVRAKRKEHPPKSIENELYKLMLNSIYGKCGQSLRGKSAFDTREMGSKKIGPSPLTNPYFAAYVTGFIRAVLSELLWKIPEGEVIYSATVDGFLTSTDPSRIDTSGTMYRRFQSLLDLLDEEGE